jgi:hypothetical protein
VQSGTATLAAFMADASMSYALAGAMGALSASAALPNKDYLRDLKAMPWLASVFRARNPSLLRPLGRRLNLDAEGGYQKKLMDATSTGNLKTWFTIQEVPPGVIYDGAVFGPDPFAMASKLEGRSVRSIIVRTGRHLGGLVRLERGGADEVHLNAWTANLFGQDPNADESLSVESYALHNIQVTQAVPLPKAAEIVGKWRRFEV